MLRKHQFTAETQRHRDFLCSLCLCVSAVRNHEPAKRQFFRGAVACFLFVALFAGDGTTASQAQKLAAAGRSYGSLKVTTGQAGSVIYINGIRHGVTNDSGVADIKRVWTGSFPVRVRSVGFADWTGKVVIAANTTRALKVTHLPTKDVALIHLQKGDALRDRGRNADAVKEYQQAIALRPTFPEARLGMTRSLIALQDFQEAEKQVELAKKNYARPYAEADTVLGFLRRQQGLLEESVVAYRNAIRIASGNAFEAHIGLGIALNELGETDEAVKEYRVGILQDMETEPILYYQLGEILEKAERKKEAIEAYGKYLKLDPEGELAGAAESIIQQLKSDGA